MQRFSASPTLSSFFSEKMALTTTDPTLGLMLAAENGYTDAIKHLLAMPQLSINQEATNPQGETTLMMAAKFGYSEAVELLLTHPKIDINHQDRLGSTSLLLAAEIGTYRSRPNTT
jgi:ankyrin repeat protein